MPLAGHRAEINSHMIVSGRVNCGKVPPENLGAKINSTAVDAETSWSPG